MLKERFAPDLMDLGFRGSGNVYFRVVSPRIDLVTLQSSRMGDKCCVNLGVHYEFLPVPGGGLITNPKAVREHHCEFRSRLRGPDKADLWWDYRPWFWMLGRTGDQISRTFLEDGLPYFEQFEPYPDVFTAITPEQVSTGALPMDAFHASTAWRNGLMMARIMQQLGRAESAREFAEVGLQHVPEHSIAIRSELEELLAALA